MSDQSLFPSLYPENYKRNPRAARIASDLIHLNYLPDPLPDGLPKPWLVAIQAIARIRHRDHNARWRAFMSRTSSSPRRPMNGCKREKRPFLGSPRGFCFVKELENDSNP